MEENEHNYKNIKIFSQQMEDGRVYYYTYVTDLGYKEETGTTKHSCKILVRFGKVKPELGNLYANFSFVTGRYKKEMQLVDKLTGKVVKVDVPMHNYSIVIWDYKKTPENIQADKEHEALGKTYALKFRPHKKQVKNQINSASVEAISNATTETNVLFNNFSNQSNIDLPF